MAIARFLESYVFGLPGFWTMAPLRCSAIFGIWQPWEEREQAVTTRRKAVASASLGAVAASRRLRNEK